MSDQLGQPKIFVPLHTDEGHGGETLFATRVRDGVYVIDCVPLFADLHHGDVVLCDESNPNVLPTLISVLERTNMTTVHLLFTPKAFKAEDREQQRDTVLEALSRAAFFFEKIEGKLYVVNSETERLDELDLLLGDFPTAVRWWRDGDTPD